MWKYVSRRIRDTFERSVNHFEKRSTAGVVNTPSAGDDNKAPCRWFCSRRCWKSTPDDNDTHSKRWNFEQLNRNWISAITWSSALVVGWYTSQIIHLKLKYHSRELKRGCPSLTNLSSLMHPYISYINKNPVYLDSVSKIENIVDNFAPTVYLISNEPSGQKTERANSSSSGGSSNIDKSHDDLGDVLNSIENRLGLAAIENGQHQDGLNLLRSAANRNHAPALYNLGLCYEMGLGVKLDEKMAMELYRSAASLEHPAALYNLGIYYGQGRGGLTRDFDTATRLLKLAAIKGQKDAIDALKTLEVNSSEPVSSKDEDSWMYRYNPYPDSDSIVPTPTTLFVENVNYLQARNYDTLVY